MAVRRSPWTTAALLAGAAALTYLVPALARWRPATPEQLRQALVDPFRGRARGRLAERRAPQPQAPARPAAEGPPPARPAPGPDGSGPPPAATTTEASGWPPPKAPVASAPDPGAAALLSDPQGALRPFHEALARTEGGQGITRIAHFGDSVVTGDLITGEARARLQQRFGDGGPGWIYPQRPWEWYGRLGLALKGRGWRIHSPLLTWRGDRCYGLAGLDFTSPGGAETAVAVDPVLAFDQVELHYLAQPKGGRLQVQVERALDLEVETGGAPAAAVKVLPLPVDGARRLTLRAKGDVALHGLVLERRGPGVVLDPLGQNGFAIQHLAKVDPAHWMQALRLRRPDLVVLAFGTNEVGYYNIPGPAYAADYREVVRRIREALPAAGILVMGPMDRGERRPDGTLGTVPKLVRIVEAQRKIAADLGLAFFDTSRAMGGEGAAIRGYQASPRLMTGDFTHPTRTGADRIARLLVDALVARHQAWKGAAEPAHRAGGGSR